MLKCGKLGREIKGRVKTLPNSTLSVTAIFSLLFQRVSWSEGSEGQAGDRGAGG